MSQISYDDELNIIAGRAMGQTYDLLRETTGHGNSTISRVLKPENLCQHVIGIYCDKRNMANEVSFYKKWLYIALGVWALSIVIQFLLFIL